MRDPLRISEPKGVRASETEASEIVSAHVGFYVARGDAHALNEVSPGQTSIIPAREGGQWSEEDREDEVRMDRRPAEGVPSNGPVWGCEPIVRGDICRCGVAMMRTTSNFPAFASMFHSTKRGTT